MMTDVSNMEQQMHYTMKNLNDIQKEFQTLSYSYTVATAK